MLKMFKVCFLKKCLKQGNVKDVKDVKVAGEILAPQQKKQRKTLTSLTFPLFKAHFDPQSA